MITFLYTLSPLQLAVLMIGSTIGYELVARRPLALQSRAALIRGAAIGGLAIGIVDVVLGLLAWMGKGAERAPFGGAAVQEIGMVLLFCGVFGIGTGIVGVLARAIGRLDPLVGVLALTGAITAGQWEYSYLVHKQVNNGAVGIVMGPNRSPASGVPVFVDRERGTIERVLTDSAGHFNVPLAPDELLHTVYLICVPGGMPMVDYPGANAVGPTRYEFTPSPPWPADVRSMGWSGPIPRECAADSSYAWALPRQPGMTLGATSKAEPNWDAGVRQSGQLLPSPSMILSPSR